MSHTSRKVAVPHTFPLLYRPRSCSHPCPHLQNYFIVCPGFVQRAIRSVCEAFYSPGVLLASVCVMHVEDVVVLATQISLEVAPCSVPASRLLSTVQVCVDDLWHVQSRRRPIRPSPLLIQRWNSLAADVRHPDIGARISAAFRVVPAQDPVSNPCTVHENTFDPSDPSKPASERLYGLLRFIRCVSSSP